MDGRKKLNVTAIYFGDGPSTYVRLLSRLDGHKSENVAWKSVNFKPVVMGNRYLTSNFFSRVVHKVVGTLLHSYALLSSVKVILKSDLIFVIKYPNKFSWSYILLFKKPVVFDFDDPIWIDGFLGVENFTSIIGTADGFTCDNEILFAKAANLGAQGIILPGYVPEIEKSMDREFNNIYRIIWIGSPSTKQYISSIENDLISLHKSNEGIEFFFLGIADLPRFRNLPRATFIEKYNFEDIKKYLLMSDIGLFPTFNDELGAARGLHKMNVYLAGGVIPICSDVGLARRAIEKIGAGYICESKSDWGRNIQKLISDKDTFRSHQNAISSGFRSDLVNRSSILDLEKYLTTIYDNRC